MWRRVSGGAVLFAMSCAAVSAIPKDVSSTVVLVDDASQSVFESALKWSRTHQLETGGCFRIVATTGRRVIVGDAVERVNWRRDNQVSLDCVEDQPIWHTHWAPEDEHTVGCNMSRAKDLYLIGTKKRLGLVVCGLGRDSVIPYNYSSKADSIHKKMLADYPAMKAEEDSLDRVVNVCKDEPAASLERSNINCKR